MSDTDTQNTDWEVAKIPGVVVRVDERDLVAAVRGKSEAEILKRARLIAAAPELLEAARDALRGANRDGYELPKFARHSLKDAIAKAKGNQ